MIKRSSATAQGNSGSPFTFFLCEQVIKTQLKLKDAFTVNLSLSSLQPLFKIKFNGSCTDHIRHLPFY